MQLPERRFDVGRASFTPYGPGGDLESDLLLDRIIMVGDLGPAAAEAVTANLLLLERQDGDAEVSLYVNSAGGPIDTFLAVYDAMHLVSCPIATVCIGAARGGAALLVAAGDPGRRAALPNSRFMLHAPRAEFTGSAGDAESVAAEARRLHTLVSGLFLKHSALNADEVEQALTRSRFLGAEEAQRAGIVDKVIERPPRAWRGIMK